MPVAVRRTDQVAVQYTGGISAMPNKNRIAMKKRGLLSAWYDTVSHSSLMWHIDHSLMDLCVGRELTHLLQQIAL
jgi:hypothetical protein